MIKTAVSSLALDARIAARQLWFNRLAGSSLIPRPLRFLMWRAGGVDLRTMLVFSGVKITGTGIGIGRGSFLNHGVYLDAGEGRIEIGHDCLIGPQVMILTATHELVDGHVDRHQTSRDVRIGDKVWLGARATILPGVTISDGCVIASGAVVTRDCDVRGMYAGIPARLVRTLKDYSGQGAPAGFR